MLSHLTALPFPTYTQSGKSDIAPNPHRILLRYILESKSVYQFLLFEVLWLPLSWQLRKHLPDHIMPSQPVRHHAHKHLPSQLPLPLFLLLYFYVPHRYYAGWHLN